MADMAALPPQLDFTEDNAFAVKTLRTRMPVILTKAIDFMHRSLSDAHEQLTAEDSKAARRAIGILAKLKYEMQTGKAMLALVEEDTDHDLQWWRAAFERYSVDGQPPKWWSAPWLFSECYMYRLMRQAVLPSALLRGLDYFQESKRTAYACSQGSIAALGRWMASGAAEATGGSEADRERTFSLLLQFSLWGNKSDLSLLADFDGRSSLDHMQAGSEAHLEELLQHILHNDTAALWAHVAEAKGSTLHIVLDNAGFEVITDLCLAHWLVTAGYYTKIVLHGKAVPWFVSDVTKDDLDWVLEQLSASDEESLSDLGKAWRGHLDSGTWQYEAHPFWTTACEYDLMEEAAPDLYATLAEAHLIILKGDLNYRKLVADRTWAVDTPLATAVGRFRPAPLCILRTLKSNTLAGVDKARAEAAAEKDADWMVSGQFAVLQAVL